MYAKCICRVPDPTHWHVIYITGRDRVVRCADCRQIWHSTASYAQELEEELVSPYEWKQFIHTPEYHKGEDVIEGEPDSYLDPAFRSIFEQPEA